MEMSRIRIVLFVLLIVWFVYYFFIKSDNSANDAGVNQTDSILPVSVGMTLQKAISKVGKPLRSYHFSSGKNDKMELLTFKNNLVALFKNDSVFSVNSTITNGLLEVFSMRDSLRNVMNDSSETEADTTRVTALLDSVKAKRKADSLLKR
jgi:hypothetical protein